MSGGITVFAIIDGQAVQADLPWVSTWAVTTARPRASDMSLAGTMIHQTGLKSETARSAAYQGPVPSADAARLETIDERCSSCILTDGRRVYEAIPDVTVMPSIRGGKRMVQGTFTIIRRIL